MIAHMAANYYDDSERHENHTYRRDDTGVKYDQWQNICFDIRASQHNNPKLPDMSEIVNIRWPPKWLPISINDYNFCSRADSLMKLVAKYMFSSIYN